MNILRQGTYYPYSPTLWGALLVDPLVTSEVVLEGHMWKLDSSGPPFGYLYMRVRFWGTCLPLPSIVRPLGKWERCLETSLVLAGLIRISVVDSRGVIGLM